MLLLDAEPDDLIENLAEAAPAGTVHRPWGSYLDLVRTDALVVKIIRVKPGCRTSLQFHRERSEHWHVVGGVGRATIADRVLPLEAGASVDVPRTVVHRIECTGSAALQIVEVQRGRCSEEDIVRIADDFGRAPADGSV